MLSRKFIHLTQIRYFMKLVKCFAFAFAAMLTLGTSIANAQSLSPTTKWHWDKGTIVVDTPERPAGQQDVLNLTAPKIQNVRVAFVGLGMRGPGAVERFCHIPRCANRSTLRLRSRTCRSLPKVLSRKPVWLLLLSTQAKRVMKNSASAATLTLFM